jgi:hypothetical protein
VEVVGIAQDECHEGDGGVGERRREGLGEASQRTTRRVGMTVLCCFWHCATLGAGANGHMWRENDALRLFSKRLLNPCNSLRDY